MKKALTISMLSVGLIAGLSAPGSAVGVQQASPSVAASSSVAMSSSLATTGSFAAASRSRSSYAMWRGRWSCRNSYYHARKYKPRAGGTSAYVITHTGKSRCKRVRIRVHASNYNYGYGYAFAYSPVSGASVRARGGYKTRVF